MNTRVCAISFYCAETPSVSIKQQLITITHNTFRHCRLRFLWDNLSQKSCVHSWHSLEGRYHQETKIMVCWLHYIYRKCNSETRSHYIHSTIYNCSYYMANSVGGQDEPNRALWLATRAYLARSGLPTVSRKKYFPESHKNPLLTKLVRDGWILVSFFFASLWTSTSNFFFSTSTFNFI